MNATRDPIMRQVIIIVAEELGIPKKELDEESGLYSHPLWDSIAHVTILIRLEAECGLTLNDEVAEQATTIRQLAELIRGST